MFSIFLLSLMAACETPPTEYVVREGDVMGTYFVVTAKCPATVDSAQVVQETAQRLSHLDALLTTYDPDSELMRLNGMAVGRAVLVSPALADVLRLSETLRVRTMGAFNVAVGDLVNAWGFGPSRGSGIPDDTVIRNHIPEPDMPAVVVDGHSVVRRQSRSLDLSAIAKGYAVDTAAAHLTDAGCDAYLVDIGGEVRVRGHSRHDRPWRIGVEQPDQGGVSERILQLTDAAVATSGDYRNFRVVEGRRISHTIDPRNGRPIEHDLASVTVVQGDAASADALATALNVMGFEEGLRFAQSEGVPALFIRRAEHGFEVRYTTHLEPYLTSEG